jgi:hypothetical protein
MRNLFLLNRNRNQSGFPIAEKLQQFFYEFLHMQSLRLFAHHARAFVKATSAPAFGKRKKRRSPLLFFLKITDNSSPSLGISAIPPRGRAGARHRSGRFKCNKKQSSLLFVPIVTDNPVVVTTGFPRPRLGCFAC